MVDYKQKTYSGFPGDCSEEQLDILNEFRELADALGLKNPPYDDPFLLRFLRARKFDLQKTEKMFSDFIQWRMKNDVDNISKFIFNELPDVKQFYPHGYHKTDKMGRPIYIERLGMLKLQQLFQITNEERLIKYYIQSYELLINRIFPQCSKVKGQRVDQTVTILDLKGSSMKMMSKQVYNFIQLASSVAQNNYPEILGKMFIINAPMLFNGIWQVIKPWLDEKTRSKITIIGAGYKEKLLQIIDEENLPEFLGGQCTCDGECLTYNAGPWNNFGKEPLFPAEYEIQKQQQIQQQLEQEALEQEKMKAQQQNEEYDNDEDEDEEDKDNNFEALQDLKNALSGLSLGGPSSKAPHNPNKYEITTYAHGVSDTPLNTQIENDEGDM